MNPRHPRVQSTGNCPASRATTYPRHPRRPAHVRMRDSRATIKHDCLTRTYAVDDVDKWIRGFAAFLPWIVGVDAVDFAKEAAHG